MIDPEGTLKGRYKEELEEMIKYHLYENTMHCCQQKEKALSVSYV